MANHLEMGVFDLEVGDKIFIFTDGFEYYMKNPEFLKLFVEWSDGLREQISRFSTEMNLKDPENYGHERSLVTVLF